MSSRPSKLGGSIVPGLPGRVFASPECSPVTASAGSMRPGLTGPISELKSCWFCVSCVAVYACVVQSRFGWSFVWLIHAELVLVRLERGEQRVARAAVERVAAEVVDHVQARPVRFCHATAFVTSVGVIRIAFSKS